MITDMETYTLHKRTELLFDWVERFKKEVKQLKHDVEGLRQLVADLYKEKAMLKFELKTLQENSQR